LDDLFFANGAYAFPRFSFDIYLIDFERKYLSDTLPDGFFVRTEAGLLCRDNAVEVDDVVASGLDLVVGQPEHLGRVAIFVLWISIGKELADVWQTGSAQQSVDYCV